MIRKILRRTRRFLNFMKGRDYFEKIDLVLPTERFGSEYGGWVIAQGRIDKESVVYSIGLGEDASFDLDLTNKYNCVINIFDPTPKSIKWARSQGFPETIKLFEFGLAGHDGSINFYLPEKSEHVSGSIVVGSSVERPSIEVEVKKLATIMDELQHTHIDLLKMDIEGAEYQVIADMLASNLRPKQVLIEFHHRVPGIGIQKT